MTLTKTFPLVGKSIHDRPSVASCQRDYEAKQNSSQNRPSKEATGDRGSDKGGATGGNKPAEKVVTALRGSHPKSVHGALHSPGAAQPTLRFKTGLLRPYVLEAEYAYP
jgi:hypothetical protein